MKCKIISGIGPPDLEKRANDWLSKEAQPPKVHQSEIKMQVVEMQGQFNTVWTMIV